MFSQTRGVPGWLKLVRKSEKTGRLSGAFQLRLGKDWAHVSLPVAKDRARRSLPVDQVKRLGAVESLKPSS